MIKQMNQTNESDALLTLPQAARALGLTDRRQLLRAAERGELEVFWIGSWPRVRRSEAFRWLADSRQRPERSVSS